MTASANDVESSTDGAPEPGIAAGRWFSTTHWSTVLAAGGGTNPSARLALESLCRTYWYPLYAYVRRSGRDVEEAQDLTQEFFARFLERDGVGVADPTRGRFRTFLLTAMKHFLANEWKKERRLKRAGSRTVLSLDEVDAEGRLAAEPADPVTPETIYERRWAATLLERVLQVLGEECAAAGRGAQFEQLKGSLWGEDRRAPLAEIAGRLGTTENACKVAAHRLRVRYRELLRAEIAQTVASPAEVDEELRHLASVMSG